MTLYEYVIAKEAGRLMAESDKRELTEAEELALVRFLVTVRRLEEEEKTKCAD